MLSENERINNSILTSLSYLSKFYFFFAVVYSDLLQRSSPRESENKLVFANTSQEPAILSQMHTQPSNHKEEDVNLPVILTHPPHDDTSPQDYALSNASINSIDSSLTSSSALKPHYASSSSLLHASNDFSFFNAANLSCSSPMYRSITSIASEEDPWRASSIGIKCISYKPVGYVFLTRRVLDLYTTDGKRKVDIVYNYSKKYRNKIRTPSIGSSMHNCSFCDTITIDFDPSSTFFDLIMEVQIITQGRQQLGQRYLICFLKNYNP